VAGSRHGQAPAVCPATPHTLSRNFPLPMQRSKLQPFHPPFGGVSSSAANRRCPSNLEWYQRKNNNPRYAARLVSVPTPAFPKSPTTLGRDAAPSLSSRCHTLGAAQLYFSPSLSYFFSLLVVASSSSIESMTCCPKLSHPLMMMSDQSSALFLSIHPSNWRFFCFARHWYFGRGERLPGVRIQGKLGWSRG
jgi:hypothetical protein